METILSRYRNVSILFVVLFAQVLGLAVQVRRPTESGSARLIRVWAVVMITPLEKALVGSGSFLSGFWHNYVWLRGVRNENAELRGELEKMRLEGIRLTQDAEQARRLQALLAFKEQFVSSTVAAQVIGSSGSEQSRTVYIDKGAGDGIKPDMAVITSEGIVGKVLKIFPGSSQVLLISDPSSGVGAILHKSRLQGILKGTAAGELVLNYVMSDEKVEAGEPILTSGGDRIFPKGMPIGTVARVNPGQDLFLNIRVKPSAQLGKLEEVLVITRIEEKPPQPGDLAGPIRAADILAERLPSLPSKTADGKSNGSVPAPTSNLKIAGAPTASEAANAAKRDSGAAKPAPGATRLGTPAPAKNPGARGEAAPGGATQPPPPPPRRQAARPKAD
jgi:rod shape-determining protein MreC